MKHLRVFLDIGLIVTACIRAVGVAQAATILPACSSSITTCCEITTAGTYVVTGSLTSTDPTADCIDINATNVNLFDAGNSITGPGSGATGIGINVMKKSKNANLLFTDPKPGAFSGFTVVSGFATGIEVAAPNATLGGFESNSNLSNGLSLNAAKNCQIYDFDTNSNSIGILISGGSGCVLHDFGSELNTSLGMSISKAKSMKFSDFNTDDNLGSGTALEASSSNLFTEFDASDNTVGGFSLNGKSNKNVLSNFDTDSNATGSGVTIQGSTSNQIIDFDAYDNGVYGTWLVGSSGNTLNYFFTFGNASAGVYLGCSSTGPGQGCTSSSSTKNIISGGQAGNDGTIAQAFGVALDTGDLKNTLTEIGASGDTTDDLIDENANCGANVWTLTSAGTTSPSSCIATTP